MNPRNWNRRFRRGKSLSCLPVRERWRMPATGPPSVFWTACPALPRCWAYAWGIRSWACASEPVWNTFPAPLHGAREVICRTEQCPLLEGLPEQFPAALYHSWRLAAFPWPAELIVTARDSGKNVQAIRHRHLPLYGIQFHPESILTPDGEALLRNFLSLPAGSREKRRIQ